MKDDPIIIPRSPWPMSKQYDAEKQRLVKQYAAEVKAFRKFCVEHGDDPVFEETDFGSLSLGFFIALGIIGDSGTGESFYDALMLDTICRYTFKYWRS
jgi:hypothetical protein